MYGQKTHSGGYVRARVRTSSWLSQPNTHTIHVRVARVSCFVVSGLFLSVATCFFLVRLLLVIVVSVRELAQCEENAAMHLHMCVAVFGAVVLSLLFADGVAAASKFSTTGKLVADEGKTLGTIFGCGVQCCQRRCTETAECDSFSLWSSAKLCVLKDRCLSEEDVAAAPSTASKYASWRATTCGKATAAANTSSNTVAATLTPQQQAASVETVRRLVEQQRQQPQQQQQQQQAATNNYGSPPRQKVEVEVAADAAAKASTGNAGGRAAPLPANHLTRVLERVNKYCLSEMTTNKWARKSGAQLGSPVVKKKLRNKELTFCNNHDWEASMASTGYTLDNVDRCVVYLPLCWLLFVLLFCLCTLSSTCLRSTVVVFVRAHCRLQQT